MHEIERAIRSCQNKIRQYKNRICGADLHTASTMNAIQLERVKIQALREKADRENVPAVLEKWIVTGECVTTASGSLDVYQCPNCSAYITIDKFDSYCPNCGAEMEERQYD